MAWTDDGGSYQRPFGFPRSILAFSTPVAVSTETPLLALTQYGPQYVALAVTLRNHDASNRAALYVDRSESGIVPDEERQVIYVAALHERTVEFRDVLRLYWGLSAAGDPDAGFPSVNVSFSVVGFVRSRNAR